MAAAREQGTTVVLVTHEPRVAAYADREVIVRDGKVDRIARRPRDSHDPARPAADARAAGGRRSAGWSSSPSPWPSASACCSTTLAGINAVNAQNARYAWLETGYTGGRPQPVERPGRPAVVAAAAPTTFHGTTIGRVDVAATGPHSPVPPGIPRCPAPGEYYASPALAAAAALHAGRRSSATAIPGRLVGTIGTAGAAGARTP